MKSFNKAMTTTFHDVKEKMRFQGGGISGPAKTEFGERHIVQQTRKLSYRFYSHFHPYVRELTSRLIERSVRGLQEADTEYVSNPDGTYENLPFSYKIALPTGLGMRVTRTDSPNETEAVKLAEGVTVSLDEAARIKLSDGQEVTLPGYVIAHGSERGTRAVGADNKSTDLPNGTIVTLVSPIRVAVPRGIVIEGENGERRRLSEASTIDVAGGTKITLQGAQPRPKLFRDFFKDRYGPTEIVERPFPIEDLDFTSSGAYSVYNWELFYHVPLTVAVHLSKNQRFEDAQRWFHFIFDPTDSSDGPTPERFWKVKPFQYTEVKQIEEILMNLSSGADEALKGDTINSIGAWKDSPFLPHPIARYRQTAFMYKAVMAYLDNLIDWGDDLFRQDTGESINEATQIYVLAALILGDRPQLLPKQGSLAPITYASRRGKWDDFGNTLEGMESEILFDSAPFPVDAGAEGQFATLRSIGTSLYFCVPRNDKMMGYWDTVADRLFKIRNSLNLQGIFRQLPLFEAPLDPALLARAAAAGLDIGAIVSGLHQPLPLVRFQLLIQKASEICQEVKSLGNNLLSAIEKEDNEALAILRARHEKVILGLAKTVKYAQWQESIKARESLEVSITNAMQRYAYYERQLGRKESEIKLPDFDPLDKKGLEEFKFTSVEPELGRRPVEVDIAQDLGDSGGKIISKYEAEELEKSGQARDIQDVIKILNLAAQGLELIPGFKMNLHFWGIGGAIDVMSGQRLANISRFAADVALAYSDRLNYEAGRAGKIGAYARREQDWAFQSSAAVGEINQMFKQLRASQVREAISEREFINHQKLMEHSQEIEDFLTNEKKGKKTNQAFYGLMKREVRGLYGQVFQFAYDVAKKAERGLQHELGNSDLTFLKYGYMAGKEGLLAGEKLYLDLKRMEMAYHESNVREYELTKHVSLLQIDPLALLQLRATGGCTVALPEELFDMDGPGHCFRRIKSVALSIPCVTGPYTSVNCTLMLTKSSIRKEVGVGDGYARQGSEDSRFSDYYGSSQAIVTSSSQNDSGMFETNLRDERYLPFEYAGVISEWQLQLPANPSKNDPCQFDYETINDVIFHIRYTARQGGGLLREGAVTNLKTRIDESEAMGSVRLFSVRHEFPTEWARFTSTKLNEETKFVPLILELRAEHYPFWSKDRVKAVKKVTLFAKRQTADKTTISVSNNPTDNPKGSRKEDLLSPHPEFDKVCFGPLSPMNFPKTPTDKFTLYFDSNHMADLFIALTWGKGD